MMTLATMRWIAPAAISLAVMGCATTPSPEEVAAAAAAEEAARQERFDSQMAPFRAWQQKFESASDRRDRPVGDWEVVPSKRRLAPGETVTVTEAIADIPSIATGAAIGWAHR